METKNKILVISDDGNDVLFNMIQNIINEDDSIELDYFKSVSGIWQNHVKKNYFIIYIDYNNLNINIEDILNDISHYYLSLPIVFIAYAGGDVANMDVAYSFDYNSIKPEVLHKQMINTIKFLKYTRNLKSVSYLPGNYLIEGAVESKFRNGEDFTLMYLDIDKFKAFSDYYGIFRANCVLTFLSKIIKDTVYKYGSFKDFIANPGGDDFIIMFEDREVAKTVGNEIVEKFDAGIKDFYDENDRKKGYISTLDRNGELDKFPISSISIISVTKESDNYSCSDELYQDIANVKKEAKEYSGSILLQS